MPLTAPVFPANFRSPAPNPHPVNSPRKVVGAPAPRPVGGPVTPQSPLGTCAPAPAARSWLAQSPFPLPSLLDIPFLLPPRPAPHPGRLSGGIFLANGFLRATYLFSFFDFVVRAARS